MFGEATEDCQRGQTRLGRQPALDVSAVRIENRGADRTADDDERLS
jgi:hypothetical protein